LGEKVHLDPDFREFVESFVTNDVRILIVGGYAVAVHGLPRYTGDLDAWIWVSQQNAERVLPSHNPSVMVSIHIVPNRCGLLPATRFASIRRQDGLASKALL
jgi:hypothetical protein